MTPTKFHYSERLKPAFAGRLLTQGPFSIAMAYGVIGSFWIIFSGLIVHESVYIMTHGDPGLETFKGLVFIWFSSLVIYLLVRQFSKRSKKQEEELRHGTNRLQIAQEIAKLGDWTFDHRTGNTYWSPQMYEIFKRNPADGPIPVETLLRKHFAADESARLSEAINQAVEKGISYDLQLKLIVSENATTAIRSIGVPYEKTDSGWLLRGIVQDISERASMEKELIHSKEQFQIIIDNLPAVLFQYKLFPDGKDAIINQGPGSRHIWGLSPMEVQEDNSKVWNQIHEADLPRVQESIHKSGTTLTPWNCIWRNNLPDGSLQWHEGFGIPREDPDGSIVWNSIILDVTDRIKSERKLMHQEKYLEFLSRHASDGIISCNADGKIVYFNDTVRSWLGDMEESVHPRNWPRLYGLYYIDGNRLLAGNEVDLVRALEGKSVINMRYILKRENNKTVFIESNGGPLHDIEGNRIGAMVILRDITTRYLREYETTNAVIEAAENERSKIAAELHDSITQLLSIVCLNLKNIGLEIPGVNESDSWKRALKHAEQAIDRLREISHNIMPSTIRDLGLIRAIAELAETTMKSTGLNISFVYGEEKRWDEALEVDLYRIVQEALNNILKHANAKTVDINLNEDSGDLNLSIIDDGIGFIATEPDKKNTGIGLRTMRNRATRWGGDLYIESDRTSTGIFTVIPLKGKNEKNTHIYC